MSFHVSRKVDMISSKFEWKIYDLKKHKKYMKDKMFLTSKQFYNSKCPSVVWEMRVYPNSSEMRSYTSNLNNYSYVYVTLIQKGMTDYDGKLKMTYNIYAIDANWKRVNIRSNNVSYFKNQTESSKESIILQKTTHPDGSILLYFEIEFIPYNCVLLENIIDYSSLPSNNFQKSIYKIGINSDCVIKIGNEKINAHRCVLANNSIVFQRMFEQENMTEVKNGEINIIDSSPECFRLMLDYFYNCQIDKNKLKRLVYDLFAIAHKYEVKLLMDKCEYIMASKINKKTFTKHNHYFHLYNLPVLERACVKYIAANRKNFLESNESKNFEIQYMEKANYLLKSVLKNEF